MLARELGMKTNRREFVQFSSVVGAGLVLGLHLPDFRKVREPASAAFEPNAYIRITSDNVITLWVTRSEMGQGVRTNLPAALAEELDVDLSRVQLEQAMPGPRFRGIRLRTSGSGSSSGTFMALRTAGATAREMLISAAAERWGVGHATCRAQLGRVIHVPSDRHFSYGELAEDAARLPVPKQPPLKGAKDFRLLGKSLRRTDGRAIATGTAQYGIDVRVPGMLFAVMERCPYIGGKLAKFDAAKALAVPGVHHVVPIQRGIAGGVAVVADHTWAAFRGRDALKVEWDPGPNKDFDSDAFIKKLAEGFASEGYPIRREGNLREAMRSSSKRLEAVYEYPFQAHAPLETMNCTADVRPDSCEIWVPTQT
ncbi:MAG TPA: molybdopterin cofactor-binding domain-containing protein, partial [Candidatus Dormibacteraeota bacterium]|nr:molybdopterin cofactor-binding domain-containing protein [Candidatus Dormibacteraeota bacterium]